MAVPVIKSPLTLAAVTGVQVRYRIQAAGLPTSFNATPLPLQLVVDTTLGQITGRVKTAGTYNVTISATNADGTGSAVLVITVTDGGGSGGDDIAGVSVYQAKWWADGAERVDYADLDAGGQPVCSLDPLSVTAAKLAPDAITTKVSWTGGPGSLGKFVLPRDITLFFSFSSGAIGIAPMPGIKAADIVICGRLMLVDGTVFNTAKKLYLFGVAEANQVRIWVSNFGEIEPVLPANSFINFRVFGLPNDV